MNTLHIFTFSPVSFVAEIKKCSLTLTAYKSSQGELHPEYQLRYAVLMRCFDSKWKLEFEPQKNTSKSTESIQLNDILFLCRANWKQFVSEFNGNQRIEIVSQAAFWRWIVKSQWILINILNNKKSPINIRQLSLIQVIKIRYHHDLTQCSVSRQ